MTTHELLASIKSRALIPISQATFSDRDLLSFATDIMRTRIVPFLIQFQEGYCLNADGSAYVLPKALVLPESPEGGDPQIPEIPEVLHPVLAQAVACQLLESLGFVDKAQAAKSTLEEMESSVIPLFSPRIGKPRKRVINPHPLVRFT